MAFLNCNWINAVGAVVSLGASMAHLQAAPIIFGFEATISDIQGGAALLKLPFSLEVGEPIRGR
jgi:hypothetical protein